MAASGSSDCENGFTLIEILVGLLISSLIMAGLGLAMKAINTGFTQETGFIGRHNALAAGLHVIGGDISRIERAIDNPDTPASFLFAGAPGEMIYVLAERPGNNRAGLYWVRLLVRKIAGGSELVRMRAPFVAGTQASDWRDEVVLLRGELSIAMSYRSPRGGLRDWVGSWQARNMLPEQIKIEIGDLKTGRLLVPVFVQTLKIGAEAYCVTAEAVGCTVATEGKLAATR
jgi:prepilin-type N-terminal cleavage/methylation domain-containing protein